MFSGVRTCGQGERVMFSSSKHRVASLVLRNVLLKRRYRECTAQCSNVFGFLKIDSQNNFLEDNKFHQVFMIPLFSNGQVVTEHNQFFSFSSVL